MEELTIYYSVQNGGDGSAYPVFMESMELAEWDQNHMSEGWGEDCSGSITLTSESPIICKNQVTTKESYYIDRLLGWDPNKEELKDLLDKFFPGGFPKVEVVENEKSWEVKSPDAPDFGKMRITKKYHVLVSENIVHDEYAWDKSKENSDKNENEFTEEGKMKLINSLILGGIEVDGY